MEEELSPKERFEILRRPEEILYQACYAPVNLREMLSSADLRSKIRKLPAPQLFFSLKELDEEEIGHLLPHLTEDQWEAVLDLDIWSRDRLSVGAFLNWERHILECEDPVARKILRGTSPQQWLYAFSRTLQIFSRTEEDEFDGEPDEDREGVVSPDGNFLIGLPKNPDLARILRQILLRLFQLEPQQTQDFLAAARFGTPSEFREIAYQDRKRRIEDLGFQDYFDAIDIYTPLDSKDPLPQKRSDSGVESTLPVVTSPGSDEGLLLVRCLSHLSLRLDIQPLVEELFFACNKLLSADRISPAEPRKVRAGLRKVLCGISLGLEAWSGGNFEQALEGIRKHYLISFFQIGYGQLLALRNRSRQILESSSTIPGSHLEAVLEGLNRNYPLLTVKGKQRMRRRFISNQNEIQRILQFLDDASQRNM